MNTAPVTEQDLQASPPPRYAPHPDEWVERFDGEEVSNYPGWSVTNLAGQQLAFLGDDDGAQLAVRRLVALHNHQLREAAGMPVEPLTMEAMSGANTSTSLQVSVENKLVMFTFQQPVQWFSLPGDGANDLAALILTKAREAGSTKQYALIGGG